MAHGRGAGGLIANPSRPRHNTGNLPSVGLAGHLMAIEFDCPHCQTHYRLKDEFGGKTATCKNPNCRKVIPIPKPESNGKPVAPADLDAIAAAAFAEEQA